MVDSSASAVAISSVPARMTRFGLNRSTIVPMNGDTMPMRNSTIDPPALACANVHPYARVSGLYSAGQQNRPKAKATVRMTNDVARLSQLRALREVVAMCERFYQAG